MRVNVYSQELTDEIALISKDGTDSAGERATFQAVRLYLRSADELHFGADDDDRSAVTIWLPKSADRQMLLAGTLVRMATIVSDLALKAAQR